MNTVASSMQKSTMLDITPSERSESKQYMMFKTGNITGYIIGTMAFRWCTSKLALFYCGVNEPFAENPMQTVKVKQFCTKYHVT